MAEPNPNRKFRGRGFGGRFTYRFVANRKNEAAGGGGNEPGASKRGSGFRFNNWRGGGGGHRPFRPRGAGGAARTPRSRSPSNSPDHRPRSQQADIRDQVETQYTNAYSGYKLYFSNPPSLPGLFDKLEAATSYLKRNSMNSATNMREAVEKEYYNIVYDDILKDLEFLEKWTTFKNDLFDKPEDAISIWGLAMHKIVEEDAESTKDDDKKVEIPYITARLMKPEPVTPLTAIKSSLLGKFVTIRGAIVRTGNVRPHCMTMTFECVDCGKRFSSELADGRFAYPKQCGASNDCEGRTFEPVPDSKQTTKLIDSRKVRIQDIKHNDASSDRGSVPRTMDCNLLGNLVKLCNAGDVVTVCGIVKMSREPSVIGDQSLHNLYIEVVSLRNHKDSERTMGGNWFTFSNRDYYMVQEMHDTDQLFRLLVASLCPSIYGHDLVKAGLLLCLLGGTPSEVTSGPVVRRSDINVLIVGDPGLGKSQILSIVSEIAPRGVYICGTSTSTAGLTVTLVKDGDEYSLEAGALVMADRGVCCIDEFDKMQPQHSALLEAMEQQSISIAKSGVFRTLPARTSVIAAANPVGGHYDRRKTVSENIKISSPLLSRFDLTFILLDNPDEEMDRNIVRHVMGIKMRGSPTKASQLCGASASARNPEPRNLELPLRERLKFGPDEEVDLIPHQLIRKYIAYAKQYVKPVLSPEAAALIKQYYLNLRVKHRHVNSTPVTTRQLESLLRLVQARAKVDLREIATVDDAKDVLDIYEFGLSGVFEDEIVTGLSQMTPMMVPTAGPSSRSQTKGQAKKLVSTLQKFAEEQKRNILKMDEIRTIGRALGLSSGLDTLISKLNNEGFLLAKGSGNYQLQSVDF